jgi:Sec-independent protein translocase protein TatA
MEIFGIGPLELIFIFLIALIVLGPSDMVKAGRTIGKFLRQIITSPTWQTFTRASRDLRHLPNKLIRDAGLEEDIKEINQAVKQAAPTGLGSDLNQWQKDLSPWTTPPQTIGTPPTPPASSDPADASTEPSVEEG